MPKEEWDKKMKELKKDFFDSLADGGKNKKDKKLSEAQEKGMKKFS